MITLVLLSISLHQLGRSVFWVLPNYLLDFYRTQVNLGSDSWVRMSVSDVWLDLTDVTLADEDTKSKLTDNAKRAIQGNEAMQVM